MQKWMIAANGDMYDHASAFEEWGFIDWRQRARYNNGDIVYIYCTIPQKKVMFKTVVVKHSMTHDECVDDKKYWHNLDEYYSGLTKKFARLQLIDQADSEYLTLDRLRENGLNAAPRGPRKVSDSLAAYIDRYLKDDYTFGVFPESDLPRGSYEGAVRTATINKYERSSIARKKCIEYHGCKCSICGMDFEKVYGPLGKGFIHVHHLVPLNQIGKEYKVDYKNDLIPVCPNCHAMLHRTQDGRCLSVQELKAIMADESRNKHAK